MRNLDTYLLRNSSTVLQRETIFRTKGKNLRFEFFRDSETKLKKVTYETFSFTFLILQEIFNVWFANKSSQSKDDHEYSEKNRKILLHALVQTFGSYFCSDGLRGS